MTGFDIFSFFYNFYYIWWKETGRDVCGGECIEVRGPLLRVSSLPPHGLQGSSSGLSPSGPARPTALVPAELPPGSGNCLRTQSHGFQA